MRRNPLAIFGLLLGTLLWTGCPSGGSTPSSKSSGGAALGVTNPEGGYTVVVTTGMVGELVRHTAGKHARIEQLMGEGIDPHLFRPTASDVGKLMQADLVLYSGLLLEGQMQEAFEKAAAAGKNVVAVTSDLPSDVLRHPSEFEGHPDPHVWHDVPLWTQCLPTVVKALASVDPDNESEYRSNAEQYAEQLKQIDDYARTSIASIPESSRCLVTAHDAFGYFSRTYGIQEKSVQGISTESEPGIRDINNLVDFLTEKKIPAIFIEATVNAANIRAVIEGTQKQGWDVKIGGTLFSDSLGAPGSYEGTYVGMLDHNVTVITRALGGEAPATGMSGKLSEPVP